MKAKITRMDTLTSGSRYNVRTMNQKMDRAKLRPISYNNGRSNERKCQGSGYQSWTIEESNELLKLMVDSHRNDSSLRTDPHPDYEDLRIAVGNGTAKGTYSIAIGDDTVEENRESGSLLDDFTYDPSSDAFIPSSTQDPFPPSPENSFMPTSTQQQYSKPHPPPRKRAKTDSQTSFDPKDTQDLVEKLTSNVEKFTRAIESIETKEYNCWDLIKEIPGLTSEDRFKALDLLNTKAKKSDLPLSGGDSKTSTSAHKHITPNPPNQDENTPSHQDNLLLIKDKPSPALTTNSEPTPQNMDITETLIQTPILFLSSLNMDYYTAALPKKDESQSTKMVIEQDKPCIQASPSSSAKTTKKWRRNPQSSLSKEMQNIQSHTSLFSNPCLARCCTRNLPLISILNSAVPRRLSPTSAHASVSGVRLGRRPSNTASIFRLQPPPHCLQSLPPTSTLRLQPPS
ncbi:F-box and associated interaction domains-containing protein [Striga asiatica]|uniref:F-box and associated interaction domains-containing protein n=1 Tax=Striga asiatica TaxID=4170 RepID=A0A5A7QR02_STRAF|nr:F-box and associated interaction domains-containing protein [Striga asiatica]